MKIRETINNNAEKYVATVYENDGKILVRKSDTFNYYDASTDEVFTFNTIKEYENWKAIQDWIVPSKTKKVSNWKKVK